MFYGACDIQFVTKILWMTPAGLIGTSWRAGCCVITGTVIPIYIIVTVVTILLEQIVTQIC